MPVELERSIRTGHGAVRGGRHALGDVPGTAQRCRLEAVKFSTRALITLHAQPLITRPIF